MDTYLKFKNIEEIKFTKVRDSVFSISIKSDIEKDDLNFKDTVFESNLCKIDSTLELKCGKEYTDIFIGNKNIIKAECFSIPVNIQLLLDADKNIFTITK